jgi:putative thioredoxin
VIEARGLTVAVLRPKPHFERKAAEACFLSPRPGAIKRESSMKGIFGGRGREPGQKAPAAVPPADRPASAALVKDATTASFSADVIAESARQPVLVDFWAPWCEPCRRLAPVLEKVVKAAAGKVKLVKMNIDEHPEIAARLGVRSIPAIVAFQRGQPIDGFMGALPENEFKGFIERLTGPLDDTTDRLAKAEALAAAGDSKGATEIYRAVIAATPGEPSAVAGLAKLLIAAGELEGAKRVLAAVSASGEQDSAILAAKAALGLAEQAASLGDSLDLAQRIAANPDDHQSRFDLAILLNSQNRRAEAADALVEIIKRDRSWSDDGARKQLLQFFEAWGFTDPVTVAARRKLSALLFS